MHSCSDLMAAAHSFAEKHFSEVIQADEFLGLPNMQVEELISSDQLTVPSEEKVHWLSKILINCFYTFKVKFFVSLDKKLYSTVILY